MQLHQLKRRDFIDVARRRGGGVAARGERAAADDAGDRVPRGRIARHDCGSCARFPPRPSRYRTCRGRERCDRLPLDRESKRPTTGAGGRIGSPTGRRHRHDRGCRAGGEGSNHDDPHRLHRRRRPGQARSCRQPRPAGRQLDRYQYFQRRVGSKAAGAPARAGAQEPLALPCSSTRAAPLPRPR